MRDLVKLFKKQVGLHGVAKFAPLLGDGSDPSQGSDGDKSVSEDSSADSSVDNLSDSSLSDDGSEGSGSSDEDLISDNDNSEDSSVEGDVIGAFGAGNSIHLHDPPVYDSRHCPPFESIETTLYGDCDCPDYGMEVCCLTDEFQFFSDLNFAEETVLATNTADHIDRIPSNILRKRLYKLLFHATDFGILEKRERRKLPNCAVAKIRQIYPSMTGDYMGYKEN